MKSLKMKSNLFNLINKIDFDWWKYQWWYIPKNNSWACSLVKKKYIYIPRLKKKGIACVGLNLEIYNKKIQVELWEPQTLDSERSCLNDDGIYISLGLRKIDLSCRLNSKLIAFNSTWHLLPFVFLETFPPVTIDFFLYLCLASKETHNYAYSHKNKSEKYTSRTHVLAGQDNSMYASIQS